ncbi:sarcosine oxidase subunit gamma [Aureimonas sp. SA4125]|uniref:sarcosine oxidase subunit gamma n=1 Tax=Aureimonas sp. SA4125 TaxID=2826993 RepID=UPI001CC78373|nr:sarcosine oxidase subunit gamma family protein [Aureimonas sp. SA4125]BDA83311.1 sarcosine oxidase subunit gamma [Aureimonas sp. SA4125]
MLDRPRLAAVSAFARLALPTAGDGRAGVTVAERHPLGLATVTLRRGAETALRDRLAQSFGITLRSGPKVSHGDRVSLIGTGPRSWLAIAAGNDPSFAKRLGADLAGTASVADQSSGYGVLRLSGPSVRAVLAKGVPLDLDASAFSPGDSAVTLAGHVGIVLWQVDAAPTYDIAVFRSHAADFWAWLTTSSAEYGVSLDAPIA